MKNPTFFVLLLCGAVCAQVPSTPRTPVTVTRNGLSFTDDFPWLENTASDQVRQWVSLQNDYLESRMRMIRETCPSEKAIRDYATRTRNFTPIKKGAYFYFRAIGRDDAVRLFRTPNPDEKAVSVLCDDSIVPGRKMHLRGFFPSDGSRTLAYLANDDGSDGVQIRFVSLVPEPEPPEVLSEVSVQSLDWNRDLGFFYVQTHRKGTFSQDSVHSVYYHALRTPQSADKLVFDGSKSGWLSVSLHDDKVIIAEKSAVSLTTNYYMGDVNGLVGNGQIRLTRILADQPEAFTFLKYRDGKMYFSSSDYNWGDVRVRDLADGGNEKVVVQQSYMNLLVQVAISKDYIFCRYRARKNDFLNIFDNDGNLQQHIEAPPGIRLHVSYFDPDKKNLYYTAEGYTQPRTWFSINVETGENKPFFNSLVKARPPLFPEGHFENVYTTYKSRDGADIPIVLVFKKGIERNGNNPLLLSGYGGFGLVPGEAFDKGLIWFLENGGIFAFANIRGGSENGPQWHAAAVGRKKIVSVNDFIDAAGFLIRERYTSPAKLAITGDSQGGLLVGAAITQRPDLFKVAVARVGVFDLSRYDRYTVGRFLRYEYGDPDNGEDYAALMAYSPYQHVAEGINYPVTLLVASENDDRVTPFQSWKFAAALQGRPAQSNPVYVKTIANSGHMGNTDADGFAKDRADFYAFIFYHLTQ